MHTHAETLHAAPLHMNQYHRNYPFITIFQFNQDRNYQISFLHIRVETPGPGVSLTYHSLSGCILEQDNFISLVSHLCAETPTENLQTHQNADLVL